MKKIIIVVFLLLLLVGCNIVTPTPQFTATPFMGVTETPTATENLKTPVATNTPDATVTPFILPSATATLPATPTQFVPPTQTPGCVTLPCGPNLFFNGGFEVYETNGAPENRYHARTPGMNTDILTAPQWYFECLTGQNSRNPQETLSIPEAGERLGQFYNYRVDGYIPNENERSQVWFRGDTTTDCGVTQSIDILEGHRYAVGAAVSTWSVPTWSIPRTEEGHLSQLNTPDDKANVQWYIRANFNNGKVYDGTLLETYDYDDGIYDFFMGPDGKNHFGGQLVTYFTTPVDSDSDNITKVNFGFTANNKYPFATTDYHIDNAFLYCLDCGFDIPVPTQDPNATPTPIVTIDEEDWQSVTVIVNTLRVRRGANIDSPVVRTVNQGYKVTVYTVYQNDTTGEIWARIDDPDICLGDICDDSEWIAVQHPACENNICAILGTD